MSRTTTQDFAVKQKTQLAHFLNMLTLYSQCHVSVIFFISSVINICVGSTECMQVHFTYIYNVHVYFISNYVNEFIVVQHEILFKHIWKEFSIGELHLFFFSGNIFINSLLSLGVLLVIIITYRRTRKIVIRIVNYILTNFFGFIKYKINDHRFKKIIIILI